MSSKVILVIEDNPINRKLMKDLLEANGYETLITEDGIKGEALAIENLPDLILMDVQLPEIDGYEVTARLKANTATKHIPIIVVTSFAMKGEEERAKAVGAEGYVPKPLDIHRLLEEIKRLI